MGAAAGEAAAPMRCEHQAEKSLWAVYRPAKFRQQKRPGGGVARAANGAASKQIPCFRVCGTAGRYASPREATVKQILEIQREDAAQVAVRQAEGAQALELLAVIPHGVVGAE